MSTFSREALLAAVRARAAERRRAQPLERLEDLVAADSWRRERFLQALTRPELALVPVCARRRPWSEVRLEDAPSAQARPTRTSAPGPRWFAFVDACRAGGAAALGVATEQDYFGGALEDLLTVAHAGRVRLRCDFPLDEAMLLESCLFGADGVRLVAADLADTQLRALRERARVLGLGVWIEVHDERELERALPLEAEALCASARDPRSTQLVPGRCEELLARMPKGPLRLAGGGISGPEDLRALRAAGAQVALVGEALARACDPAALLRAWREACA
ncbi:MAG: indole-3-glycerol-phosphate synthase TrpC [Planctomycetes bacterium]|nr:indole-3-glycerol-phosphate synthase TrpC [Planctomycetota bacterium]